MKRQARVWFDVEDLFDFAERHARPTGIQRVCFEIYRSALNDPAMSGRIGFLRHAQGERGFVEADWSLLASRFQHVTDRPAEPEPEPAPAPPAAASSLPAPTPDPSETAPPAAPVRLRWPFRQLRRLVGLVPQRVSKPGILFAVMQAQAGLALTDTVRLTVSHRVRGIARRSGERVRRGVNRLPVKRVPPGPFVPTAQPNPPRRLNEIAERGDMLVVLGSPWFELEYAELAGYARGRLGMRLAVLMHDVIPVRRPEWVDRGTVRVYRNWYRTVLPLADLVLSNSRATAQDVEQWCAEDNIRLRGRVVPLPIGSGFGLPAPDKPAPDKPAHGKSARADDATLPPSGLPAGPPACPPPLPLPLLRRLGRRPYVLFVSTIEARKNHLLLFRVWRRLLDEMGSDRMPDLVFAGRVGWLVNDLMDQIQNSRHLDGRLHVIQGLDDASLRALYDNCLFTVFPSFYEGWGLPVSESLVMGAPCICSNATSLPEAGGALARYFDPSDLNDASRVIRDAIVDGPGLVEWRARVAREYTPVGWDRTASALLEAVDLTD